MWVLGFLKDFMIRYADGAYISRNIDVGQNQVQNSCFILLTCPLHTHFCHDSKDKLCMVAVWANPTETLQCIDGNKTGRSGEMHMCGSEEKMALKIWFVIEIYT